MNKHILHKDVQDFIKNYKDDITTLAFTGSPFTNITTQELIQQIESRQKAEKKLPTWYKASGIYYPPKLNIEQTSSEVTAKYKSELVSGTSLADLTGGFGVDSYFFAKTHETVTHYEINAELSAIARHNFGMQDKKNIECISGNGIDLIEGKRFDTIYADPSRRHDTKGKVFFLADCEPNIPKNLSLLLERCNTLLLKTSPMLDITVGLNELAHVADIHIVAVENEVKELLWLLRKSFEGQPILKAINFSGKSIETFQFNWNKTSAATYDMPKQFLYEPNAAIMKSGGFNAISEAFKLSKLHTSSHLYTGDTNIEFPGRAFTIKQVVPYSKKSMKKALTFTKANITVRNFPETVATLRKKWKIKEGGDVYLFFTTLMGDEKAMIVCRKQTK
ncbi:hypothetical protein ATE92_2408 [Ulvibacter sp. MAR_2010_11]|uniref:THUMP-like domain-containing protein n=1 Tax=Ulvibacter sp. MAR_2010_11 TaxID=1250229 RepID=UPI000C2BDF49|nr:class I SAM-dependent methyltransferase [Ulvibacter sp. MAR_2010_11]PKA84236.1 hypothetical protein ATE92_2408 [Ulvibacter sp. MAR_2010_11]